MGRDQNTFLKRQREMEKRRKAVEKRVRRQKRKEEANGPGEPHIAHPSTTEE
jgi:hypothetical protein